MSLTSPTPVPTSMLEPNAPRPIDAVLGQNLAVARGILGMTQQELASAARVSRATIAQLEAGSSDPRLSTVVELASALGLSPLVLLMGEGEVKALAALHRGEGQGLGRPAEPDVARMREALRLGLPPDRIRAARIGAAWSRVHAGASRAALLTAAVLSAVEPAMGAVLGVVFGRWASAQASGPASAGPRGPFSSAGGGGPTRPLPPSSK